MTCSFCNNDEVTYIDDDGFLYCAECEPKSIGRAIVIGLVVTVLFIATIVLGVRLAHAECESPPPVYDHAYAGEVVIDDHWDGGISAWDGPCYPFMGVWGCAHLVGSKCKIDFQKGKLSPVCLRHEVAHCNGWRH